MRSIARQLHGRVLDYGCGYGRDVSWLRHRGVDATGYDPASGLYGRPPCGTFAWVLMVYVVNVISSRADRLDAVQHAWRYVEAGGTLYLAARSVDDVHRAAHDGGWERCEDGWCSGTTWQGGMRAIDLLRLVGGLPSVATARQSFPRAAFSSILVKRGR